MGFYRYDQPARGSAFIGRDSLVRALVDGLHRDRSFALVGGPLTGRTSLLAEVERQVQQRWRREPKALKVVPVSLRLRGLAQTRAFPQLLWDTLGAALAQPGVTGADVRPNVRVQWHREGDPWKKLGELLDELWKKLRGTTSWCRWALMLDDADLLFSRDYPTLLDQIAKLREIDGDAAPAALIVAGGRGLREHLLDTRAVLSFARPLFLGPMRIDEATQLIRSGFPDLDERWIETLLNTSGRHPWVLTRLLAELEAVGIDAGIEAAIDGATEDTLRLFARVWQELDGGRGVTYRGAYAAPEHALMQIVLDFASGVSLEVAERELGIKPLREYAELLEYLGLVERVLRAHLHELRPHFDLWNIWYGERILR